MMMCYGLGIDSKNMIQHDLAAETVYDTGPTRPATRTRKVSHRYPLENILLLGFTLLFHLW